MTARSATVLIGAAALAVALFLLLRGGGEEGAGSPPATAEEPAAVGRGDGPQAGEGKPPAPEVARIVVRGGQPVGGVAELEFERGERIRFEVASDVADHVHLHGYDVFEDVAAGGEVGFDVPATIEGVFEVELEDRVVPIAEITVTP